MNDKIRSSPPKAYSYLEFCNSLIHLYTGTSFNIADTQADPIYIHYYDMKTGLLVLINQHGYEDFLEAVAQKNVRSTGGYVNICLSLQDRQLMEEDNDIQICSSRLLVGYRLTFRIVLPSLLLGYRLLGTAEH